MQELINVRVHDYYWDEDLSCAVTTLKILSELFYTELHPQVVEAAFGLNAGRFGSQCGLVEGALLFIGSYGSYRNMNKEKITAICHEFCRPGNPPHLCENITKQAVAFSAQFIVEEMGMAC
ncbi:MAG: GCAxxG family protein [Firmicutes bacterium]|nr:GCAxxG family protein [Bacillota bacterium]